MAPTSLQEAQANYQKALLQVALAKEKLAIAENLINTLKENNNGSSK